MTTTTDTGPLVDAVERIGRMVEAGMKVRSPFHLAACGGCGGPSFQQPCPHCRFYPMGDAEAQRARTPKLTAEQFRGNVERTAPDGTGNLATWLVASQRSSAAHRPHSAFAARTDALMAEAARMEGLPSPDAVYATVTEGGASLNRPFPGMDVTEIWGVLFELRSALERGNEAVAQHVSSWSHSHAVPAPEGVVAKAARAADAVVAAVHGDEDSWEPAMDDLGSALEELSRFATVMGRSASWAPVGNLNSARARLDALAERRAEAKAPAP
jgi:hypothetical protein